MPERNIEFGQFGAQGVKGHQLVARRLDSLAGFITSPLTTRRPSARTLCEIDTAYQRVRRHNVARRLQARLERGGRGTRVEFHPVNQSAVDRPPRQRVVEYRTLNVRKWERIVAAWQSGNDTGLDDAWVNEVVVDLGSQWGQYGYVTNIGFAA